MEKEGAVWRPVLGCGDSCPLASLCQGCPLNKWPDGLGQRGRQTGLLRLRTKQPPNCPLQSSFLRSKRGCSPAEGAGRRPGQAHRLLWRSFVDGRVPRTLLCPRLGEGGTVRGHVTQCPSRCPSQPLLRTHTGPLVDSLHWSLTKPRAGRWVSGPHRSFRKPPRPVSTPQAFTEHLGCARRWAGGIPQAKMSQALPVMTSFPIGL